MEHPDSNSEKIRKPFDEEVLDKLTGTYLFFLGIPLPVREAEIYIKKNRADTTSQVNHCLHREY